MTPNETHDLIARLHAQVRRLRALLAEVLFHAEGVEAAAEAGEIEALPMGLVERMRAEVERDDTNL